MDRPDDELPRAKALMPVDVREAHEHCNVNRAAVEASTVCGCFYCCAIFSPAEIDEWIVEGSGRQTAQCPRCGIDSVIPDRSGYPITKEFLATMNSYWFT
ncbi:MAG: cytoplasmic protein [Mycobacterium sp.]